MRQIKIDAYTASKSFVFGGQKLKGTASNKNWNLCGKWVKNITLECYRFCPTNGVHLKLKVADIDSTRMLVRIKQGKGNKDRNTILSKAALKALREYL